MNTCICTYCDEIILHTCYMCGQHEISRRLVLEKLTFCKKRVKKKINELSRICRKGVTPPPPQTCGQHPGRMPFLGCYFFTWLRAFLIYMP